jgi:purine nucleosidase
MNHSHKLIVDTDIGSDIDDALALLLLLHLKEIDFLGITTVYGNVELRGKIAQRILKSADIDVPVVVGLGSPLMPHLPLWHTGKEGVGILNESELQSPLSDWGLRTDAPEFLVEQILASPGNVTILAIGALTNVARALEIEPRFVKTVRRIVFMGAGVTYENPIPADLLPGNEYVACPSHNVRCDVEAARRVFAARLPITVLTNDVTTRVWWGGETVQYFLRATEPLETVAVAKLLKVWLDYRTRIFGQPIEGTCPHDPLTVAEAVYTGKFVKYVQGWITVRDDASTSFIPDPAGPHSVGVKVNQPDFLAWFVPRLLQRGLDG